jgi:hypothetical protein
VKVMTLIRYLFKVRPATLAAAIAVGAVAGGASAGLITVMNAQLAATSLLDWKFPAAYVTLCCFFCRNARGETRL